MQIWNRTTQIKCIKVEFGTRKKRVHAKGSISFDLIFEKKKKRWNSLAYCVSSPNYSKNDVLLTFVLTKKSIDLNPGFASNWPNQQNCCKSECIIPQNFYFFYFFLTCMMTWFCQIPLCIKNVKERKINNSQICFW